VTYIVKDGAGNQATCNFTVTITDNIDPIIICPMDVIATTSADGTGNCTTTVLLGTPTTADNCSVAGVIAQVGGITINPATYQFPTGITIVNWIVTDGSGRTANCNQTVTVNDDEKPVITCPTDVTISCEDDNTPTGTGVPIATDNCTPAANIVVTFSDLSTYSVDPASVLHYNYTIIRTWRATDVSGNYNECTQTITVHDITKPIITCPADVTISCEDDNNPTGAGTATATDNCAPVANITVGYIDLSTNSPDPASVLHYNYIVTRTWRATDVAGNYNECTQIITVHDITKPVITCPSDVTLSCEDDNTPAATGTATAADNCAPVANITVSYIDLSSSSADPASVLHYNYIITRTWRATDVTGNYNECIQTITVHDITKPVITCPADITLSCEDDNTPAATGTATATDICTPVTNITVSYIDISTYSPDPASVLHYNYMITRTWRATDVAGNYSECIQTITVHDITKPVITCPADVTISCEDDNTPTRTGTATATDNCAPGANITIGYIDFTTYSIDPASVLHYNYTITRTWRATDVTGNYSECTQTIMVHDITNPTFTVPATITICRASDCTYDIGTSVTGDVTDESDNCAPGTLLNATFSDDLSGLIDCNNYGFILRTWSLTDIAGNTTVKVQTIWIEPTPTVTIVNNSPIICDSSNVNLLINSPTISTTPANLSYEVTVTSTDPAHLGGTASISFTKLKADLPFSITGSLTNSSDAPILVTYTITPKLNGCSDGPVQTTTVTVNPTGEVDQPVSQVVCNGDNTTTITFTTVNTGGATTYTWTNNDISIGLAATGSGDIPTFTAINAGTSPVVATIIVTPHFTSGGATCDGPTKTFTIKVNPTGEVDQPASQVVCNGGSTTTVTFTTVNTGGITTYTWTNNDISIGLAATGSGNIPTFTATNAGTSPVIATIIVTPHFTSGGVTCNGPTKTFTITVNPTGEVDQPASQVVCNGSSTATVTFATVNTGGITTYTWTNDQPSIGLAATGSGNIPTFTAINAGTAPVIATIIVTPHFTSGGVTCDGPTKIFTITVNPTGEVDQPVNQVVCNGADTAVNFATVNTGGITTYTWTNSDISIGLAATGSGNIPTFTAINAGISPVVATIIVTPHFTSGGATCDGPTKTFTITVNPTAQVNQPANDLVCNGAPTAAVVFGSINTGGVLTYTWTNNLPSIGLAASGSGDIPSFTAINAGTSPVIATIIVTPHFTNGGVTCEGPAKTFTITVNPTGEVDQPVSQVVCNGGSTATVTFTTVNTGGATTYTWTNSDISIGLAATGSDNIPTFTAINAGTSPVVATIIVTAHFTNGGITCDGPTKTFTITVNPTGEVDQPASQVVCNGGSTTTVTFTTVTTGGVTTYTWTNNDISIGLAATGSGNIPTFTATNLGTVPVVATIIVTPHFTSGGVTCDGPTKTFTITINPTGEVDQPVSQVVCNGSNTTTITFTTVNTGGATTYTWTNDQPSIGLAAAGSASIPTFTAINAGTSPVIATIIVTPHFTNAGVTCDGPAKTFTITVNPTGEVDQPVSQVVCNGDNTTTVTFATINTGGVTTYTWTNSDISIGLVASGTGNIPSFVATNISTAPVVATIIVTPHFINGGVTCDGPTKTFTITVDPTAEVNQPPSEVVCNGDNTTIVTFPTINTGGITTYTWTNNNISVGLGASGTGNIPSFVATNTGTVPVIATIIVTPHFSNGGKTCDGPTKTFTITVNPTGEVNQPVNQVVCNGDNTTTVTFATVNTGGITTYTWTNNNISIGLGASGTGNIPSFIASNPGNAPVVATIIVTPHFSNGGKTCNGPTKTFTITVNPIPEVDQPVSQIICNGANTTAVNFTTVNTGGIITYTWTNNNISIGLVASGIGNIPSFVATNAGNAPVIATIIVTPHFSNGGKMCDGPTKIFTITVNPTPQVFPSTSGYTICNYGTTSVILTSPSTFTSGVITFNYTVVATGGVTGFNTPVTGLLNNSVISDVLHNPTDTSQTVTYTIVPISPTGCAAGPSKTVVITVDPTLQLVPSTLSQTICNDGITDVKLYSPTIFSSGVITFNYTVVATGGVTGFTTPVAGLPNNSVISDVLHNPTDTYQTVTYRITPISPRCSTSDPDKIVIITVNPTPRIYPVPSNSTQCDSTTTNIQLQSPSIFTSGLIKFKYTVATTGSMTGYTSPITGLPNNQIIGDKLINNTDHFQIVTYTVVPISPIGCTDGPSQNITVTVNPTPRVVPNNIYPSICYVGTPQAPVNTQIVLNSPTVMTSGAMRFDYTVNVTGGPGVIVGNTSPAVNLPPSYAINFVYQNNSDTIQSVYYTITPKVDNAICVPGKKVVSEIKVHAKPLQSIVVTKPLTCSGGAGLAALKAVISKGANPYQVVWDGPVGYHKVDSLAIANLSSGKYVIKVTDNLGCNRKDSISIVPVTARAYISADVIPPGNYNISCIGSTDGTILVSVTGGITPPYNYWVIKNDHDTLYSGIFTNNLDPSNPSTYKYYNNLGAGSYTLDIKDVNTCENLNKIVFRVPPPIVNVFSKSPFAGGYNISCKGYNDGYATVQTSGGHGGYSYRWYTFNGNIPGPVNTNRIDNLTAGTYYLETKDVLNCVQIDSTVIKEPDGMQLSAYQVSKSPDGNFNISCNGGTDGSIGMTISGGSGNYIYSWTGPAGFTSSTKDLTGLKVGVYTCLIRDENNCILTPSPTFTLTEPSALVLGPPATSVSTDGAYNINCYGANSGWIRVTVSGGSIGTYNYNWSTLDGSGIISGQKDQTLLTAGTYHLVVTDFNNCVITKDITLTQPLVFVTQLTPTNVTCKSAGFNNGTINLTVTGGVAPYSYLWSNGATTEDLTGLTPGTYNVTVTDFNGCIKKDSARVDLPPVLNYTRALSDFNGYNISCNGLSNGFINVDPTTGSAPFVYTWTGPNGFTATTKNISDLKAGQYKLLIVDNNECKASETFNLTEPGKLGLTFTLPSSIAGGFNINCAGESTGSIDIEPENQVKTIDYLWSDGIFGKTRINLPAGNYTVIITDANNCHANSTITITEPDSLKLYFSISQPFCPDKPDGRIVANVTGGVRGTDYSYIWSDNSTNSTLANIPAGYYKVTVTDMNGCSIKDSVTIQPVNETCLVIPNAISPNGDLINDVWNIGLKELYPSMEVIIFNRWGETVWRSEKGYPRPWDGTSNGSSLPIDSYHYIIDLHNGSRPIVGNITIVR
jgi:gliding motility-associated-like protein